MKKIIEFLSKYFVYYTELQKAEKRIDDLELRLWIIENPPKYKVLDEIGVKGDLSVISYAVLPPEKKEVEGRLYVSFLDNFYRRKLTVYSKKDNKTYIMLESQVDSWLKNYNEHNKLKNKK